MSVLLNDTNTYLKITDKRSNPTTSLERDLNKLLLNIRDERMAEHPNLDQNCTKCYIAVISHQHLFMVSQKSTKLRDHSGPLLVAYVTSPTYVVSKHLVSTPSPLRRNSFQSRTAQILRSRFASIPSPVRK